MPAAVCYTGAGPRPPRRPQSSARHPAPDRPAAETPVSDDDNECSKKVYQTPFAALSHTGRYRNLAGRGRVLRGDINARRRLAERTPGGPDCGDINARVGREGGGDINAREGRKGDGQGDGHGDSPARRAVQIGIYARNDAGRMLRGNQPICNSGRHVAHGLPGLPVREKRLIFRRAAERVAAPQSLSSARLPHVEAQTSLRVNKKKPKTKKKQ